jgi:hypothetical protein
MLRPKFIAADYYNSKHIIWSSRLTNKQTNKKSRALSKVIQRKNYSFLSNETPTYWPTDGNKIPDLRDFFVTNGISSTYRDIQSSYDLTLDHPPITATLSTSVIVRKPTSGLQN